MVTAIAGLFEFDFESRRAELSKIARRGSGSACRSLMGGIVAWNMGANPDGSDSMAEQIVPRSAWPNLEAIICVASDKKKHISSTAGMQTSVETSVLLAHRAKVVVPERFAKMIALVKINDEKSVLELAMRDSNQFHACCLDTYPPIFYMTDTSRAVVRAVDDLNAKHNAIKFGYTFDAGPNAVIFCDKANVPELLAEMLHRFPPSQADLRTKPEFEYVRGRTQLTAAQAEASRRSGLVENAGEVMYFFHTGIGEGSRVLQGEEAKKYRLSVPEA